MNDLILVKSDSFGEVVCDFWKNEDEEILMTSNQLGTALGYVEPRRAINKIVRRNKYLESSEFLRVTTTVPTSLNIETRLFTEDGIYEITMMSGSTKAKEFRAWIRQVLKGLRQGTLVIQQQFNLPKTFSESLRRLAETVEEKEKLQKEVEILKPKANKHDIFLQANNAQTMLEVAKSLDIGRNNLMRFLRYQKILMSTTIPYERFRNLGLFKTREFSIVKRSGAIINCCQTFVTAKGLDYICELLEENKQKNSLQIEQAKVANL